MEIPPIEDPRAIDPPAGAAPPRVRAADADASLVAAHVSLRDGRPIDVDALRPRGEAAFNAAERFLFHQAAAEISLRTARDHLYDALRAIEFGDRHLLGQFVDASRLSDAQRASDAARPGDPTSAVTRAVAEFGLAAIARGRWTPGLDAIAQALRFDQTLGDGSLAADAERCGAIADRYQLAARTLGRRVPMLAPLASSQTTVALLCSGIEDDAATARLLTSLATRPTSAASAKLRVYSTEAWTAAPSGAPQLVAPSAGSVRDGANALDAIRAANVDVWLAPVEADSVQKSRMLVERLARDRVDVLLIDAPLADVAAWMAVASRPVPRQLALLRQGVAAGFAGVDGAIDLDAALRWIDADAWAERGVAVRSIVQGVDVDASRTPVDRRAYGIAADAVVMATLSRDPSRTLTPQFAQAIARALAEVPRSVYLVVGPGPCDAQRRIFDAAGVGRRVGFAGRRRDTAAFLAMSDLYVAEPPASDREGVLTAMALGKPVAILGGAAYDRPNHSRLVGQSNAIGGNVDALLDRVIRLLREPTLRQSLGATLAARAAEQFTMAQTLAQLDEAVATPARSALVAKVA